MSQFSTRIPVFLLIIFIFLVYSNSFKASWHFDDSPNIIGNQRVHFQDIKWNSFKEAAYGLKDNISRPLSYISFGINWYFGKDNIFGYHVVNFIIHAITSILLFLVLLNLFKTPRLQDTPQGDVFFIALFATTLWAVHPIQVQAVTYIVQRMASMAALFYLLGIFFYLHARLSTKQINKLIFWVCTFLAYIFAICTKQNTAVLPLALILIEILFFAKFEFAKLRKYYLHLIISLVFIGFLGIFVFMEGNPLHFLKGYEKRGFTLSERLLTEPRILIFYLTQLFYPVVTRLSITHDIELSTSLIHPWTTLPAILLIIFLLIFACHQARKRSLISLAIFFFFLNHLIESTIIPLELIFEHRNYLPSLFLFLPIAAGIKYAINYYQVHKRSMYIIVSSSLAFLLIFLGFGTYTRNMTWASEKTLWQDAMEKAPQSARPKQNLANYYSRRNQLEKGYALNKQAIFLDDPSPKKSESLSYFNLGGIHQARQEYEEAIHYFQKATQTRQDYTRAYYQLAKIYMTTGQLLKADHAIDKALNIYSKSKYVELKSLILLKKSEIDVTIKLCGQILKKYPNRTYSHLLISRSFIQIEQYARARFFLKRALKLVPNDTEIIFTFIENEIKSEQKENAEQAIENLLNKFPLEFIEKRLKSLADDPLAIPMDTKLIANYVTEEIREIANSFTGPVDYVEFFNSGEYTANH